MLFPWSRDPQRSMKPPWFSEHLPLLHRTVSLLLLYSRHSAKKAEGAKPTFPQKHFSIFRSWVCKLWALASHGGSWAGEGQPPSVIPQSGLISRLGNPNPCPVTLDTGRQSWASACLGWGAQREGERSKSHPPPSQLLPPLWEQGQLVWEAIRRDHNLAFWDVSPWKGDRSSHCHPITLVDTE